MPEVESEFGRTFFLFDGNLIDSVEVVCFPKVNFLRVEILLKTKVNYSIEQIKNKLEIRFSPDTSIVAQGSEGSIIKKDRKPRKSELEKELEDKDQRIQKNQTRLQRLSERLDIAKDFNLALVQKNQVLRDQVKALHHENLELSVLLKEENFEVSKYRSLNSTLAQKLKELEVQAQQLEEGVKLAEISKNRKREAEEGGREEARRKEEEQRWKEAEAKRKKEEEDIQFEIKNRILSWRSAWTSKDIAAYMSYYSTSFWSGNSNWDKWKRDKEKKFQKNRILQVKLGKIRTFLKDGYVEARFKQTFRSDSYRDFGVKTLRLIREEKDWKIVRES